MRRLLQVVSVGLAGTTIVALVTGCAQDSASKHLRAASELLAKRQRAAARSEISVAIRVRPSDLEMYLGAMELYERADMHADKAEIGETLARQAGSLEKRLSRQQLAGLYALIGRAHWDAKQTDAAEENYATALRLDPDNALLLNDFGYFYAEQSTSLPEALSMTQEAVRLLPGDGFVMDSLGWVLYKLGRYPAARTALQEAVALAPDHAEIRYHLGVVYAKLNQRAEARVELGKALLVDNSLTEARQLLTELRKRS